MTVTAFRDPRLSPEERTRAEFLAIAAFYRANPENMFRGFASRWVQRVRQAAKRQGREFALAEADLMDLAKTQGYRCALSGLPFDSDTPGFNLRNPFAPSVDRIDCAKGYTPENIRLVCVIVNLALNSFGDDALLKMCRGVCEKAAPSSHASLERIENE